MSRARSLADLANENLLTALLATTRIGIGTTDPSATLEVSGDARVTGILTVGSSSLTFDGDSNVVNVGTALTIGHTQGVQFHTQNLHSTGFEVNNINASGVVTATSFSGDGSNLTGLQAGHFEKTNAGIHTLSNIGIGTDNPTTPLEVQSDNLPVTIKRNSNTGDLIYFRNNNFYNVIGGDNGALYFKTNGTSFASERLRITSGGNVGIGTTNPTSALTVSGDADVTGNIVINSISEIGATSATLSTTTQTAIATISASTYRSAEFTIQATEGTNYHGVKVLVLHDGTTAYNSQYGEIITNTSVASFDADISGGNIRLLATGASANSTTYKVAYTGIQI